MNKYFRGVIKDRVAADLQSTRDQITRCFEQVLSCSSRSLDCYFESYVEKFCFTVSNTLCEERELCVFSASMTMD